MSSWFGFDFLFSYKNFVDFYTPLKLNIIFVSLFSQFMYFWKVLSFFLKNVFSEGFWEMHRSPLNSLIIMLIHCQVLISISKVSVLPIHQLSYSFPTISSPFQHKLASNFIKKTKVNRGENSHPGVYNSFWNAYLPLPSQLPFLRFRRKDQPSAL